MLGGVQEGVVWHKEGVFEHLLDHGVAPLADFDGPRKIHLGAGVVVVHSGLGKAAQHVRACHGPGSGLDPGGVVGQGLADLGKALVFQGVDPVLGREDGVFQLLELFGDIALAVDQGLLADVRVRHQAHLALGHLDVVAEDAVVAHPQVFDAGFFLLSGFDAGQHILAAGHNVAQLVDLRIKARADDAALAQGEGGIV